MKDASEIKKLLSEIFEPWKSDFRYSVYYTEGDEYEVEINYQLSPHTEPFNYILSVMTGENGKFLVDVGIGGKDSWKEINRAQIFSIMWFAEVSGNEPYYSLERPTELNIRLIKED